MQYTFISSCPIVVKHCSFLGGEMKETEVLDTLDSTFLIIFLRLSNLEKEINKVITITLPHVVIKFLLIGFTI